MLAWPDWSQAAAGAIRQARPERTDLGWLIRLEGPGEDVLPAGVDEAGHRRPSGA